MSAQQATKRTDERMFEVGNVTIKVRNLDKSIDFYTDKLDMTLRTKSPGKWAEVEGPGVIIGIHALQDDEHTPSPGDGLSIGFHVADIHKARKELHERGVEFLSEPKNDGPVVLSYFADPDGNPLYLAQYK